MEDEKPSREELEAKIKQLEGELSASENRFSRLLDNISDYVHSLDDGLFLTFANKAMVDRFFPEGYEGKNIRELFAEAIPEEDLDRIKSRLKEEGHAEFEHSWKTYDGKSIYGEVRLSPAIEDGEYKGINAVFRDITKRKTVEDKLKKLNERYTLATESGGMGVWDLDLQKNELHWDNNMYILYGVNPNNFEGAYESWKKGLHPDDLEKAVKEVEMAIAGEKDFDTEFRIVKPDGEVRILKASAIVKRDEAGNPITMIGLNEDVTEVRKARDEIIESEQRYKKLFDNSNDCKYIHALDDPRFLRVNKTACDTLGYTPEEFMNMTPLDIDTEEKGRNFEDIIAKIEREGKVTFETSHRTKDGRTLDFEITSSLIRYKGKTAVYSTARDITERKISEVRFKGIVQRMSSACAIYQAIDDGDDFLFVDFNEAGQNIENVKLEDILGKKLTEVFPGVEKFGLLDVLKRVYKTGVAEDYPIAFYNDERISGWRENHIFKLGSGEVVAVYDDLTDKKIAERKIKERDAIFRKLGENVPGMIYQFLRRTDGSYSVTFTTDKIEQIFGCTKEESAKDFTYISRYILSEDIDKVIESIENSARTLTDWKCEFRVQLPGEEVKWILGNSTPEKKEDGSIVWYGFSMDMTEQKNIEMLNDELQLQMAQDARLSDIGRLAAGIAHNLNNPLAGVLGYASMLMKEFPKDTRIEKMYKAGDQMKDIIHTLMTVSRDEQNQNPRKININDVLQGYIDISMGDTYFKHEVKRTISFDDEMPPIKGIYCHFSQSLGNLIQNSVHAMKGNDERMLQLRTYHDKEKVYVEIEDNGCGIPEAVLPNIFSPFFTTKPRKDEVKDGEPFGTGLGLYFTYEVLTKKYNADITVDSVPGKTVFKVAIPRSDIIE